MADTWVGGVTMAGRGGTAAPGITMVRAAGSAEMPEAGVGREPCDGAGRAGNPVPGSGFRVGSLVSGPGAKPVPGGCGWMRGIGVALRVSGGRAGTADGAPASEPPGAGLAWLVPVGPVGILGAEADGTPPGNPPWGRAGGVTERVIRSDVDPDGMGAGLPGAASEDDGMVPAADGGAGRLGLSDPPTAGTGSGRLADGSMPMRPAEGSGAVDPGARSGAGRVSS